MKKFPKLFGLGKSTDTTFVILAAFCLQYNLLLLKSELRFFKKGMSNAFFTLIEYILLGISKYFANTKG